MRKRKDITRCVCGTDDADGMMIQCENSTCRVWQHVDCMGLSNIPKTYFCEECSPDNHPYFQLFQSKSVSTSVQGSKVVKKRQTMNSRQLDFEMGIEMEMDHEPEQKEPTPPPPPLPKPKKKRNDERKEQLKKIQAMIEYFEQFELPEFCKQEEEGDCCQECEWESGDSSLSGSLKEVQIKVYHALLRYQLQC